MVDADLGFGRHRRLGVERHAGAGKPDHVEVVGAVADGNGVDRRRLGGRNLAQSLGLGGAAEDGSATEAEEAAILLDQPVGAVFLETEFRRCGG